MNNTEWKYLKNLRILIIEDDPDIIMRLKSTLKGHGVSDENIKVANSKGSFLKSLNTKKIFDLLIVDLMIPDTDRDYTKIEQYKRQLEKIRTDIEKAETEQQLEEEIDRLIENRLEILKSINKILNKDAGIEVIEEFFGTTHNHYPGDGKPAIIYLTAVGDKEKIKRGTNACGKRKNEWLVKPVPTDTLISTIDKFFYVE